MKIVMFANTDWYLFNFRLSLATRLRSSGYEVLLVSPPGPYGQRLRELGFRWEPVRMNRRSLSPLAELRVIWTLARLFRRERPAIVHGFTIKCAVYGSLAGRLAGVPGRVNAVTGLGYVFTSQQLLARMLRPFVSKAMKFSLGGGASRLVLQNEDDRRLFLQGALMDPSNIRVIPGSGVDCKRFLPRSSNAKSARPRVLLAARLLWDKGIAEYAECSRLLVREGWNIDFLLAGLPDEGNPASVPRAVIENWAREGLLEWVGHVDDMAGLFRTVDIVVLPSYREGLPKGLIEAGACALPIVATDVPGCREVVFDGDTGLLVAPRDARGLADAVAKLISDPDLARGLGERARARVLDRFADDVVIAETIAVYSELIPVCKTDLPRPTP